MFTEKLFTFNLPNITFILRRNIPFKIPPAEVELTSASKFEEVHSNNFEKAMGGACISFTSLITGLNKGKNNFENLCIGKELYKRNRDNVNDNNTILSAAIYKVINVKVIDVTQ